jgi:hypothetical protein
VHYDYALFLCHFGETLPLIKISGYAHNNALSALSVASCSEGNNYDEPECGNNSLCTAPGTASDFEKY